MPPEFSTITRIAQFVAESEELMGQMNNTFYGPTEPCLCLVGKIPPGTWDNCRGTSEIKSRTQQYDELVDLLNELAMEIENISYTDKYSRKHWRKETSAERNSDEKSFQTNPNEGKECRGQLKQMHETSLSIGKRGGQSFLQPSYGQQRGTMPHP